MPPQKAPAGAAFVSRYDGQCNLTYLNPLYNRAFFALCTVSDSLPPTASKEHVQPLAGALLRVLRHGEPESVTTEEGGGLPPLRLNLLPEFDRQGAVSGVILVSQDDIDENHKEQVRLRQVTQRLQSMARRLVQSQEDERSRIAGELHDQIGQNITAFFLSLNIISSLLADRQWEALNLRIEQMKVLLKSTVDVMRGVLTKLRPPALQVLGIVEALRGLAREAHENLGLEVNLSVNGPDRRLDNHIELALYRIAQESLTNVARYSRISKADILLGFEKAHVRLDIHDMGRGFLPTVERRSQVRGLGLTIMRERVEAVGGILTITSKIGQGTRIVAILPG